MAKLGCEITLSFYLSPCLELKSYSDGYIVISQLKVLQKGYMSPSMTFELSKRTSRKQRVKIVNQHL